MENKIVRDNRKKKNIRKDIGKEGYRLSVYRSNKNLFCQVIEQETGKIILGMAERDLDKEAKKTKSERAFAFGEKFAAAALDKGVKAIKFDRGSYLYHGRVKAFADGARKGGLEF